MIESLTKDKVADSPAMFEGQVAGPLKSVLDQIFLAVSYWILDYDREAFSVEQPNDSGILFASLHFERSTIEISWGWEKPLRSSDLAYHIQVLPAGQMHGAETMNTGNYREIADVDAVPWQEAIGRRLSRVEVIGLQGSPQAIRFSFSGTDVFVAIGYGGSDLLVGDGDDLLVFSEQEWQNQKSIYGLEWERIWTASATRQS